MKPDRRPPPYKSDGEEIRRLYTKRYRLYCRFFIDCLGWDKRVEDFLRASDRIQSNRRILDAGCGTGVVTKTLYRIALKKGLKEVRFYGFDVTPVMLDLFREWAVDKKAFGISLRRADVLSLKDLPKEWREFDLIVASAMLEHVRSDQLKLALLNLKRLLKRDGKLLVFITRRNAFTTLLVKLWWKANVYNEDEIKRFFEEVGFRNVTCTPFAKMWLNSTIAIEGTN